MMPSNKGIEHNIIHEIIKDKLFNVLYLPKLCGLCFDDNRKLHSIEMEIEVNIDHQTFLITLERIINYVFHDEMFELVSKYVCEQCYNTTKNAYIFIWNARELSIKIGEYFNKLNSSIEQLASEDMDKHSKVLLVISDDTIKQESTLENDDFAQKQLPQIICDGCQRIFTTQEEWELHKAKYHSNFTPKCLLCSTKFKSKTQLSEHVKTCALVNCQICHKNVPKDKINNHLEMEHSDKIFQCNHCNLITFAIEDFKKHLKLCSKRKCWCFMCLKKFRGNRNLKSHKCKYGCTQCSESPCIHYRYLVHCREQALHGIEERFSCVDCDYTTAQIQFLIDHANKQHLKYHPFVCTKCGQQFYSKNIYIYHIRKYHSDNQVCQFCDKVFLVSKYYEKHLQACRDLKRKFQCAKCVANFNTEKELSRHSYLRHSSKIYPCDLCKAKFISNSLLRHHKSRVHNGLQKSINIRILQCSTCLKKFSSKKDYIKHIKIHGSNRKYICGICKEEFKSLLKLQGHRVKHRKERTERVICKVCNLEVFVRSMKLHQLYHAPRPYVCENCGKSFPTEGSLKLHVNIHQPYSPCPKCQIPMQAYRLKRHFKEACGGNIKPRIPIFGARPLRVKNKLLCQSCDYQTRNKHLLEAHFNRIHLNRQPYVCEVCERAFLSSKLLNDHMTLHLLGKGEHYTCQICNLKFYKRTPFKKHVREHKVEMQFECDLCKEKFVSINILQMHKIENHMMQNE